MNQHTALTTRRLPYLRSILNSTQDSEDAGRTCGNSEYESPNTHSRSNGVRESTANTQSISEPRSTVQLFEPGQPMPRILPTTPIGSMPSPGGSSLVHSSQSMSFQFLGIDDPRRKPNPEQRMAFSTEPSRRYETLRNTRQHSMGSRPGIDATEGFSSPTSTAARSHSHPSVAFPKAHIHPPYAAVSPQNVQGMQDPSAHLPDMQPYLGTSTSGKAVSPWHEGLFNTPKGQYFITLPGSNDRISVPVDVENSRTQEKRNRNAAASQRHREKKKRQQNELPEEAKQLRTEVKQLRTELREMRECVKIMEEEQNSHRDLIMHAQWLIYWAQASDSPSQTSKTTVRMDSLAARPQNYGGGSSPGERPLKRCRTSQVLELPASVYGAFVNPPTGRRGSELPPKQTLQDTSTRWVMSQNAGVSTPSTFVANVR